MQRSQGMLRAMFVSIPVALLAACSGASPSDLFDPVSSESSGTEAAPGSAATPVGGGASTSPPTAPLGTPDAGMPPPKPSCTDEGASNDTLAKATPFDACLTGKVAAADIDYGAIVAPKSATKIAIDHEEVGGKVSFRIFINGVAATPAFTGDPPDIAVIPGATYQFQMRTSPTNSAGERTYVLRVRFE
jgi:hypothetical protein